MAWLLLSWHKVLILLVTLDTAWDRGIKLWERFRPIEEYIERRHERRHNMIDPITLMKDVQLAVTAVERLKAAAPRVIQLVNDVKQSYADKGNAAALEADLVKVLGDVQGDIALLEGLFPKGA